MRQISIPLTTSCYADGDYVIVEIVQSACESWALFWRKEASTFRMREGISFIGDAQSMTERDASWTRTSLLYSPEAVNFSMRPISIGKA